MNQVIIYSVCFIIGISLAVIFFRLRLKKIITILNQKIRDLQASFSAVQLENLSVANGSRGSLEELLSIADKISAIKISGTAEPELKEKSNEPLPESNDFRQKFDNLIVVNELGQRVTSSLSLNDVFQHLYGTINSMMDSAVFELGVYYWKDNRWQILSNLDSSHVAGSNTEPYRNHMAEWCLQNNREIILENAEKEFARYVFSPLVMPDGRVAQSVLSFPIYRNEKERGALTVVSFRKSAFNGYHVDMIRSLIPYVSVALDNALVHQELIVTQNQLIHNEKMASIGQLSSGIAHEILNPLNFVNNFSELSIELFNEIQQSETTEDEADLKEQLISNLDKINYHGNRAYNIVQSMMQMSRAGNGEKTAVNINNIIKEALQISYKGFRLKVKEFESRIETNLDPKLPVKQMVMEDFNRVLINVFTNAFYAMNEKIKKLKSANTDLVSFYEPELIVKTSVVNAVIHISVRDNGTGIPDEIKNKIFLPFFTTKPTGEGTGLGLSLSHDIIVKGNEGEIRVNSEPGKWTEFLITLPVH